MEDELTAAVNSIVKTGWELRAGQVIPESEDITLGNAGVTLDATVLYADLTDSTLLEACLTDPTMSKVLLLHRTELFPRLEVPDRRLDGYDSGRRASVPEPCSQTDSPQLEDPCQQIRSPQPPSRSHRRGPAAGTVRRNCRFRTDARRIRSGCPTWSHACRGATLA